MTEQEIIQRAKAGDMAAFHELYQRYRIHAFRTAFLFSRDHYLAEDITQEAFVRTYRYLRHYRNGLPFKPWFTRIVINACRTALKHWTRVQTIADAPDSQTGGGSCDVDLRLDLWKAVSGLPLPIQEVVVLRYYHDLKEADIAALLEIPLGTVKSRVHRARQLLEEVVLKGKEKWAHDSDH